LFHYFGDHTFTSAVTIGACRIDEIASEVERAMEGID
jgi:hypothetical protein